MAVINFIDKIQSQILSTNELEKNIYFISDTYYHDHLVKCLTLSYLGTYLLESRRYKTLSILLQKYPQLKIGNHSE